MFEWYASGEFSLEKLSRHLFGAGFVYHPSKPRIQPSRLEDIMKNPFYIGRFQFAGQSFEGAYSHLITVKLFEAVQAAFRSHNHGKQQKHNFNVSGLLTCGECGRAVTAEIKKGKYINSHCAWRKGPLLPDPGHKGCCLAPMAGVLAAGGIGLTVAGISRSLPWILVAVILTASVALFLAKRSRGAGSCGNPECGCIGSCATKPAEGHGASR